MPPPIWWAPCWPTDTPSTTPSPRATTLGPSELSRVTRQIGLCCRLHRPLCGLRTCQFRRSATTQEPSHELPDQAMCRVGIVVVGADCRGRHPDPDDRVGGAQENQQLHQATPPQRRPQSQRPQGTKGPQMTMRQRRRAHNFNLYVRRSARFTSIVAATRLAFCRRFGWVDL